MTNVKYSETQADPTISRVEDWLIRDLVEAHPETLGVLAPLGIDLCCGGGHPLGEALDLHGLDRDAVLPQVARAIGTPTPEAG